MMQNVRLASPAGTLTQAGRQAGKDWGMGSPNFPVQLVHVLSRLMRC